MSGERIAELALLSYPPSARVARGEEMLATLQDASAGSRRRFVREIADLVRLGLRARGSQTASAGARRIVADGLCLAAVWLMTLDVSTLLSQRARGMHDPLLSSPSIALLAAVLALALIGYDRLAGAGALLWTALRLPALWDHHAGLVNLAPEVLPIVCFCVLALAPRRRAPTPGACVAAGARHPRRGGRAAAGEASPLLVAGVLLAALLVVVAAVALLPTDPRLAIAAPSRQQPRDRRRGDQPRRLARCTPVRRRRPARARRRGHSNAAPARPAPSEPPRGFTNSEPFPGLRLGGPRDGASRRRHDRRRQHA